MDMYVYCSVSDRVAPRHAILFTLACRIVGCMAPLVAPSDYATVHTTRNDRSQCGVSSVGLLLSVGQRAAQAKGHYAAWAARYRRLAEITSQRIPTSIQ